MWIYCAAFGMLYRLILRYYVVFFIDIGLWIVSLLEKSKAD